jgi:hypothetical protein
VAEPTVAEVRRLMRRMNGSGTVKRFDVLHEALVVAYRVGAADAMLRRRDLPVRESCLEGA